MVQENTSNSDADTEIVDYPAPRPLNRVGVKVGLGMGLLLSLSSSSVGVCGWGGTRMGMPSFSPGVIHRTYPRFPGKDHQPNGIEREKNWE